MGGGRASEGSLGAARWPKRCSRGARATSAPEPPFYGGTAVGQWRMTANCNQQVGMTALSLASTGMFVLDSNRQFQPAPPRTLSQRDVYRGLRRGQDARPRDRLQPHRRSDRSGAVLGRERERSLEPGRQPDCARQPLVHVPNSRLLALLNLAMADTAFTIWRAKRDFGGDPNEVTWRPWTAILLADTDGSGATVPDSEWRPLVATPCHPEYPAGHPAQNGAAATRAAEPFR